jgi:hypothetical protein
VRDQLLDADALVGAEEPMPEPTRQAITGTVGDARFVAREEAARLATRTKPTER